MSTPNYKEQLTEIIYRNWKNGDEVGLLKEVDSFLTHAIKQERETFKKAFFEEFSGAGELWFPYNSELRPMTNEEEDSAVEEYWERILSIINNESK